MKDYLFITILFIMSLVANLIFIYSSFRNQKSANADDSEIQSILCTKEVNEIKIERLNPDPLEELRDIQGNTVLLNSIMANRSNLILVIGDNSCGSCVDLSLNMLKSLIAQAGFPIVTVLGYYENKREFFILSKQF